MRTIRIVSLALVSIVSWSARAETPNDIYNVNGKNFTEKGAAIRYVIALGKPVTIYHTRCEILTNKLSFKACPKVKTNTFENAQFAGLKN